MLILFFNVENYYTMKMHTEIYMVNIRQFRKSFMLRCFANQTVYDFFFQNGYMFTIAFDSLLNLNHILLWNSLIFLQFNISDYYKNLYLMGTCVWIDIPEQNRQCNRQCNRHQPGQLNVFIKKICLYIEETTFKLNAF